MGGDVCGSDRLRALYLDETRSGVRWLIDPDSSVAKGMLRAAESRTPTDVCDPIALAADLDDARLLLFERHIGVAAGAIVADELYEPVEELFEKWRQRLRDARPLNWGQAIGADGFRLRTLLGDSHARLQGEDPALIAEIDPRHDDPVLSDEGPIIEERLYGEVLYVRIRLFAGNPSELAALGGWSRDHQRHFAHERIIVDLRGNRGGDDSYTYDWIEQHIRRDIVMGEAAAWFVDDRLLGSWAAWLSYRACHGDDNDGTRRFHERTFTPGPASVLTLERVPATLDAGASPWEGQMLVVIDAGTASSGESSAVILREGLDARVIGSPSRGRMRFGNVASYPLPRSGLVLRLCTSCSGLGVPEFTGIPVDTSLDDASAPPASLAADFDRLWDQTTNNRRDQTTPH